MQIKNKLYVYFTKRIIDIFGSIIVLFFLLPVFLILIVLTFITLGHPVFFVQKRIGKNNKIFNFYKFRTMKNIYDQTGYLLPDNKRITKFGQFLRKTSLDEIPEIFIVITGNMSLIGPRPLPSKYLPFFNKNELNRHLVKPGITGLAQVNGRNSISWEGKFQQDLEYVSKVGLLLDILIIFKTIFVLFKRKDIHLRGQSSNIDFDEYRKNEKK
jgi:lipopolysaccharide/colanic/teichoic acid biosynthesis glycosyltransferase